MMNDDSLANYLFSRYSMRQTRIALKSEVFEYFENKQSIDCNVCIYQKNKSGR